MIFSKEQRPAQGRLPWLQPPRRRGLNEFAAALVTVLLMAASAATCAPQYIPPRPPHPILLPEANNLPDINTQMKMRESLVSKKRFDAANIERKRQIDQDTAILLRLAASLNAEMAKAAGQQLPPIALREIDEIEHLAHNVKEKMKLTVGAN